MLLAGRLAVVLIALPLPLGAPQTPPIVPVQAQVTPVMLAGTLSVIVAPVTGRGPLLRATIAQVTTSPDTRKGWPSSLAIERSAVNTMVSVAVLSPVLLSSAVVTVAVFTISGTT